MKNKRAGKNGILSIDVGGSGVKGALVSFSGQLMGERIRIPTPKPCPPKELMAIILTLADQLPGFSRIAVGFPGYVRKGVVRTAPNLDPNRWYGFPLAARLKKRLKKPARVVNDADLQGLSAIYGRGLELVVTLGTGFGTGLFLDGLPLPHIELSEHPVKKNLLWDAYIGEAALKRIGKRKWNRRVRKMIEITRAVFNFDTLFIGGGNAKKISFKLPRRVRLASNQNAALGGAKLWKLDKIF